MEASIARSNGIYYTVRFNPFKYRAFGYWAQRHAIASRTILEPFAGANNIIGMLQAIGLADSFCSYDLYPKAAAVQRRDTIADFPTGFEVCITNPPWLYKSSAKRRGLPYPETGYDDFYKHCLALCLEHSPYIAALVPASFLQSGLFRNRLEALIVIQRTLFECTESPVCLALFAGTGEDGRAAIYIDDDYIGTLQELVRHLPPAVSDRRIVFNVPDGALGFIAIDNSIEPSIGFCFGSALQRYHICHSSRSITRIAGVAPNTELIARLNERVARIRTSTRDVFLTTFKGLRRDGGYRRRMEYGLARDIICSVCAENNHEPQIIPRDAPQLKALDR